MPNATARKAATVAALIAAYPEQELSSNGNELIWRDGTRITIDDGNPPKSHADWLAKPDLKDMLFPPYPAGKPLAPPAPNVDPGRARNHAFFSKMYGDCTKKEVTSKLTEIIWLPKSAPARLDGHVGEWRR